MLFANQLSPLVGQCFSLCLEFVECIIESIFAWLFKQFLWLLRWHCLKGHIILVPVKGRAWVAGRVFLPRTSRWLFLILFGALLLQLGLILGLLSQWLGWVNQTLLNILLWHVLKHYIYYIDVVQPIQRRKSHKLQRILFIHLHLCFLQNTSDEREKSIDNPED